MSVETGEVKMMVSASGTGARLTAYSAQINPIAAQQPVH